ncbi:iron ABC transporter permease [Agrobacterium tumefaciens]|uniref:FecCD family ABC transporter permease n=1 Tax=Agrobacterium TaxID=357 RepID=UPI000F63D46E|nr:MULTISPECIES: iron ABC transporter permease [Agrobacterium]MDA5241191.1 iron ABC transporter permease [Agrobacterium sp. MAFF310724]MDA5249462.1 iron ABC transporter permease [Agrobacterium sp. MAFF210268]RRN70379.1 iron ABC transporter permease [Agrobacterium deltaense]TRB13035.1 iron ABC transporter permease [Agrobacterium tumefaciens]
MIRLLIILTLLLAILVAASLAFGDVPLTWQELYNVIAGMGEPAPQSTMIVFDLRLPRALLALLVGVALATAGTITLAIMRNPLAEPGVLGINSGAAAAAMAIIVLVQDPSIALIQTASFLGAAVMALAVYALSWRGGTSSLRIILIGIGLSSLATAGTTFLSAFGDIGDVQRAMIWLAGSVYDANMMKVQFLGFSLVVPIALAFLAVRELDLIRFGDHSAKSLGQPVDRIRGLMIVLVTVLSGAAVAASGLIGFVGLVAPHIARRLTGASSHARILPVAVLVGACLVVAADLIGRIILPPAQLPAGIVTSLIGAPFFAYLLWGRRHDRG